MFELKKYCQLNTFTQISNFFFSVQIHIVLCEVSATRRKKDWTLDQINLFDG